MPVMLATQTYKNTISVNAAVSSLGRTIEASISTGGSSPTADPIKIFPDRPSRALLVQVTISPVKRIESVASRDWSEEQITNDGEFL